MKFRLGQTSINLLQSQPSHYRKYPLIQTPFNVDKNSYVIVRIKEHIIQMF